MILLESNKNLSVQNAIIAISTKRKRVTMNLDEYKAHVEATRKTSTIEALSKMSVANAIMETLFNLKESETN